MGGTRLKQRSPAEAEEYAAQALKLSVLGSEVTIQTGSILDLAGCATLLEDYGRAARLFAAVEAKEREMGHIRDEHDREFYGSLQEQVRSALGAQEYERLSREGYALHWSDLITYALRSEQNSLS
ncbi:MAG TPA: hypothetical protein PKA27_06670 [Fimbriimonadaceae bacterium]|nr:hypothetical protein [Fimbriimonadaceae bacterium]